MPVMRGIPVQIGALLLVAVTAHALADELPADPRLDAFVEVCLPDGRPVFDAMATRIAAAGWVDVEPSTNAELEVVVDRLGEAIGRDAPTVSFAAFSKTVEELTLFLILSDIPNADAPLVGCYFYDLEAELPVPAELAAARFGGPPAEAMYDPLYAIIENWGQTAAFPGIDGIANNFVPEDSGVVDITGFTGVSLLARWTPAAPR